MAISIVYLKRPVWKTQTKVTDRTCHREVKKHRWCSEVWRWKYLQRIDQGDIIHVLPNRGTTESKAIQQQFGDSVALFSIKLACFC